VSELVRLLDDPDAAVRAAAIGTIWTIFTSGGGNIDFAKPALVRALNDPEPGVRRRAVRALGEIGNLSKSEVLALAAALKDRESEVRSGAANAIASAGGRASAAIPALEELLNDPNSDVRETGVRSLTAVGSRTPSFIAALVRMLKADDNNLAVADALRRIGPMAKEAIPALRSRVKDTSEGANVRAAAAHALWSVSRDASEALPVLVGCLESKLLQDKYPVWREGEAVPKVLVADDATRKRATEALIEIASGDAASKELVRKSVAAAMAHTDDVTSYREILRQIDEKK
jgi:HEAT repeat protein